MLQTRNSPGHTSYTQSLLVVEAEDLISHQTSLLVTLLLVSSLMDLTHNSPSFKESLEYNDYQDVMKELNGDKRIVPITGNQPGEKVSTTMVKATPGGRNCPQENSTGATTNRDYVESTTGNNTQTDFQSQEK